MDTPPVDQSIVVIVLGPVVIAALVGALVFWLRARRRPGPRGAGDDRRGDSDADRD